MKRTALIMAGGTGGHVFPALAVAEALANRGCRVIWLGTRQGIEARLVPNAGYRIEWLPVGGLRGKGVLTLLAAPFTLLRAGFAAWRAVARVKPDVVLGMGGFASGPGGVIAWLQRRPLLVHEQNAIPGFTNRVLARFARRVLTAFPDTLPNEEVVGNPVRDSVVQLPPPHERMSTRHGRLRVLVLGGSLGARSLNENVPRALLLSGLDVEVRHQCGRDDVDKVRARYTGGVIDAEVEAFIDDMAEAYAWADLVICRAGAMTVFEIATAGLAAVFVPYPHAVDDHQTANARYLADVDAAVLMQERDLRPDTLAELLGRLADRERLLAMASRARSRARIDATQKVAEACLALAGEAA